MLALPGCPLPWGCRHSSSGPTQTPRHKVQPTAAKCQEAGREERMFPVGDLRIALCLGVWLKGRVLV